MMVSAASYGMLSTTCGWSLSAAHESVKWTIEALKSLNYSCHTTTTHWDLVVCEPSPAAVNETNRWNYVKTTETSVSDTTPDVIKTRSFDFSITQLFKSLQKILSNQGKFPSLSEF